MREALEAIAGDRLGQLLGALRAVGKSSDPGQSMGQREGWLGSSSELASFSEALR